MSALATAASAAELKFPARMSRAAVQISATTRRKVGITAMLRRVRFPRRGFRARMASLGAWRGDGLQDLLD